MHYLSMNQHYNAPYKPRTKSKFMKKTITAAMCLALTSWSSLAMAEETFLKNVLHIQAEASQDVANDQMKAVLYIERSDKNPTQLATQINQLLNNAVQIAKKYPQVQLQTGSQNTQPIYDDNNLKLKQWRTRAQIELTGQDFKATSQLISELQEQFNTQSIGFSVSDQKRKQVEDELMVTASKNFQQRAQLLSKAWNAKGYQLGQVNINTNYYQPPVMYRSEMMMASPKMADAVPAQDVQSGESKLSVSANGSIQLY